MMLINGFLFTLGSIAAFIVTIIILLAWAKGRKKPVKATAKDWREYLAQIVLHDEYAEATQIAKLLLDKKDSEEIDTPIGYKVDVIKDLVIDENAGEGLSKIKVQKTFKIKKITPSA